MSGRTSAGRAEPRASLAAYDRLAPPPPHDVVAHRIERFSAPDDVVLDLYGRGGRVARAALDRQRRAISLESGPLSRLLAELVLRPPEVRHLDGAFEALGTSPHGPSTLRLAIAELFATHCPTCGGSLVADEFVWGLADGSPRPIRKHYRCTGCRDQDGRSVDRDAAPDEADLARAAEPPAAASLRQALRNRFPVPQDGEALIDDFLALHSDRQLVSLGWILERIEGDVRAEPIEAALRLAFLEAVLPSSRLAGSGSRTGALKVAAGRLRPPATGSWRERNTWLALEDGYRRVRSFVERLDASPDGPVQARFGDDLASLVHGPTTVVVRTLRPATLRALANEGRELARFDRLPRVPLAIGQPPRRPTPARVALAFHGTAWALGHEAAAGLPVELLLGASGRPPWGWQAAALRRTLEAVEPLLARDGRLVLLVDDGAAEALVAAALAGTTAGYRLLDARLGGPDGVVVDLGPPGSSLPPGPRTRANVALAPLPGGAGDPDLVPARGLFAPPERVDARPFSTSDARRVVTETVVDLLRARGEPAPFDRLLPEILVGLDRTGQLRRLASSGPAGSLPVPAPMGDAAPGTDDVERAAQRPTAAGVDAGSIRAPARSIRGREPDEPPVAFGDDVERLVALIREELTRPTQRRLVELEPDRWWLADREDRQLAAAPLADRVEWATYSLLSAATSMSEDAFVGRIMGMFDGYDLPDEALVRACLESYRGDASAGERLVAGEDVVRRTAEEGELLASLVDGGRRLGMEIRVAPREQARVAGEARLGGRLSERERNVHLPVIARGSFEDLAAVDCIWYVRGRMALMFEVAWTAMLGETLRRHEGIPPDHRVVRFLVVPPERTELVRLKIDRSPLLRSAIEQGNWHILKWNHLRSFLAADLISLDGLEALVGLDPAVERSGEQMSLFAGGRYP